MKAATHPLRVFVIQMGARRGYELARMLEQRGSLAALQTSTAWREGEVSPILLSRIFPSKHGAISRRTVVGLPRRKVRTTFLPEAAGAVLDTFHIETERRYRIEDWLLGAVARRRGLAGANVVLNTTGNGGIHFLRWAKRQGAKIVTDIVITPHSLEIVAVEQTRWLGWTQNKSLSKSISIYRQYMERVVDVSDVLLCPSDAVADGLSRISTFDAKKIAFLPYALGGTKIAAGKPVVKRILFSGEPGLRKGLPYLALAARELRAADPRFEIYVAGRASDAIRARAECQDLTFLGYLSPAQMAEEYKRADVFCLPSLAEGMASVTLEALARGVPCVVTQATGAPVSHGVEGLIVPERDAAALTQAIASIANDRKIRETMSIAAMERAGQHVFDIVSRRLVNLLDARGFGKASA